MLFLPSSNYSVTTSPGIWLKICGFMTLCNHLVMWSSMVPAVYMCGVSCHSLKKAEIWSDITCWNNHGHLTIGMEGESLYRSGPHALMMAPVTTAPAISLPPQTDFVNTSAEVKDLEYHGWLTRAGIQCRAPRMDEWQNRCCSTWRTWIRQASCYSLSRRLGFLKCLQVCSGSWQRACWWDRQMFGQLFLFVARLSRSRN